MNEVINTLSASFPNINPTEIKESNLTLGKFTSSDFIFDSKDRVTVKCTEYYKGEHNYVDHLRVAINKIDKTEANPDKIKKSLSEQNLLVEDWGGKVQCSLISAKTGEGIEDLLDKVLLEAEILNLKANKDTESLGTIIESRLDKGLGPIATVLIQKGTLNKGDIFL